MENKWNYFKLESVQTAQNHRLISTKSYLVIIVVLLMELTKNLIW